MMPRAGVQNAAAWTARVSMLICCSGAIAAIAAKVLRRAHDYGVGAAVLGQRQRGFFRDQASSRGS
jgi:hypothetical protein